MTYTIKHDNVQPPLYWAVDEKGNQIHGTMTFSEEETKKRLKLREMCHDAHA